MRWLLILVVAGCLPQNADVEGSYTATLSVGDNGCHLQEWMADGELPAFPLAIDRSGSGVDATFGDAGGIALEALLGTPVLTGRIDDTTLDLSAGGNRVHLMGSCAYTVTAYATATSSGDVVSGTIRYVAIPAGDCLAGCVSIQTFEGARPPS